MDGEVGRCPGMPMPGAAQHLISNGDGGAREEGWPGLAPLTACFRGTLLCLFLLLFVFHYFLFFFKSVFSTCSFTSQQGQDMGFTTLQAPALLLSCQSKY